MTTRKTGNLKALTLALAIFATGQAAAQSSGIQELTGDAAHGYAVFLGTGLYKLDDRQLFVLRIPASWQIRDQEQGNTRMKPFGQVQGRNQRVRDLQQQPRNDHVGNCYTEYVAAFEFLDNGHQRILPSFAVRKPTPLVGFRPARAVVITCAQCPLWVISGPSGGF